MSTESDLATVQTDLAALRQDVSSLLEHLRVSASNGAQSAANQLDDGARRVYRSVAAESERSIKALGGQIEAQPVVALLVALGVGFVGGRLLSR
jgi:ElaB/YqjD/DUF883 family membrane-anchored ribosome-binding protein